MKEEVELVENDNNNIGWDFREKANISALVEPFLRLVQWNYSSSSPFYKKTQIF